MTIFSARGEIITRYNNPVKQAIAQRLIALNQKFYSDFGRQFSETRRRIQPGVLRILDRLDGNEHILDLGCGNGELVRVLARRDHHGAYLGLDFSLPLLTEAQSLSARFQTTFVEADLSTDWDSKLRSVMASQVPAVQGPRDQNINAISLIFSFATLHHIPTWELRLQFIQKVRSFLPAGGCFIHSNWQFMNSPRLRKRVQEWNQIGLTESDVDSGDYLLDWRSGGRGLRYVHHFEEAELAEAATTGGFHILDTFYSDGKEGNLAIYQVWQRK